MKKCLLFRLWTSSIFTLVAALLASSSNAQSSETLVTSKTRLKETQLFQLAKCSQDKSKINCLVPVKLSKPLPEGTTLQVDASRILSLSSVRFSYQDKQLQKQSFPAIGGVKFVSLPQCSAAAPNEDELKALEGKDIYVQLEAIDASEIIAMKYPGTPLDLARKVNYEFRWDKFNPSGSWARYMYDELDNLPTKIAEKKDISDIKDFCPYYDSLDLNSRKIFWIGLFNEIAYRESLFIPLVQNDEGQYSERNAGVVSRGLMQMSFDSLRSEVYQDNGCAVRKAEELHQPLPNLKCGLAIFSALIGRDGCIACSKRGNPKGPSVYWSTLRSPYQIECGRCGNSGLTLGKKAGIIKSLKNRVSFCFPPMTEEEKKAALASMAAPACPTQQ